MTNQNAEMRLQSAVRKIAALFAAFLIVWAPCAWGTIDFVHLTDPHLFDSGDDAANNENVFRWCVDQINDRVAGGAQYAFVVVTGDLGLEKLPSEAGNLAAKTPKGITDAAQRLGKLIQPSKVGTWLFVPGNNDLVNENPVTISNYYAFIRALQQHAPGISIIDLCPRPGDPRSGFRDIDDCGKRCRFIGFNNASFKSNDSESNALAFAQAQLTNVAEVRALLSTNSDFDHAFIFYHIPELEDPHWSSLPADDAQLQARELRRGRIAKTDPLSAWTVTNEVRSQWNSVVEDPRVRGLFAGHFHSSNPAVYEGFGWMQQPGRFAASLQKLYVAPPIALKRQEKIETPARGYREISIDCMTGRIRTFAISWISPAVGAGAPSRLSPDGPSESARARVWEGMPNITLLALGAVLIAAGFFTQRFARSVESTPLNQLLIRVVQAGCIALGVMFCALAFKPRSVIATPAAPVDGWDLLAHFVLLPTVVILIVGALFWIWGAVMRQSRIRASSTAHTTMLLATLALGAVVIGFAVLTWLAQTRGEDASRVVAVAALWALAALAIGAALGFLFGTPRAGATATMNRQAGGTVELKVEQPAVTSRTNLEEISEWLTKLIIGGTLFQSGNIAKGLGELGSHFARTVSDSGSGLWTGVGSAIPIYFGLVGLFGAYFPTRLYLNPVLLKADEGERQVVAERTGLPETKLNSLEAAPLNVEGAGTEFDPIAKEAAEEIGRLPLQSLNHWRDIRLWAKAKLSAGDYDAAIAGYQKAIEIVPHDAETRLGYAAALAGKGAPQRLILSQLEAARDSLTRASDPDLRKNIYKSLAYQYLYLKKPESFIKALNAAREYFRTEDAVESGGLWVNVACAYGQAYAWLSADAANSIKVEDLMVKSGQPSPPHEVSTDRGSLLSWVRALAYHAAKTASSRDAEWKKRIRELMGLDERERPEDNDLEPFKNDAEFQALVADAPSAPSSR